MKYLINMKINKLFLKSKKKRKKGFTLIELVAVLAIIAILSAAFVPKFSNYITEAKKVTVLNEAISVVTAYEAVSHKLDTDEANTDISTLVTSNYTDISPNKLPLATKVSQCRKLLDPNTKFEVSSAGILISVDNDTIPQDKTDNTD